MAFPILNLLPTFFRSMQFASVMHTRIQDVNNKTHFCQNDYNMNSVTQGKINDEKWDEKWNLCAAVKLTFLLFDILTYYSFLRKSLYLNMVKPTPLTSVHNSYPSSNYFFQNLIQPTLAATGVQRGQEYNKSLLPGTISSFATKDEHGSSEKSKQVQRLAKEVASLLQDEHGLITEVENGKMVNIFSS